MKSIAVFCDGTWNNKDHTKHDTSIARIYQVLEKDKENGRKDIEPHYIPGVGANNNLSRIGRGFDKWTGGALGVGLSPDIKEAYTFIQKHYEPGDKIFIFGFSRGAYTGRSLAGLIRASGIVDDPGDIERAFVRYRNRAKETRPNTFASMAFRASVSSLFHTNQTERNWRDRRGKPPSHPIDIAYLGILDTVGTYGVPGVVAQLKVLPGGHGFHDHILSSLVRSGRHAVGLDERRRLYAHTPWDNLRMLNAVAGPDAEGGAKYRQEWFPGDHGMLGGSGKERRISNTAMHWILDGARIAGLSVKMPQDVQAKPDDHLGGLSNRDTAAFDPTAWVQSWRKGPDETQKSQIHPTTWRRVRDLPDYRPESLRVLNASGWTNPEG